MINPFKSLIDNFMPKFYRQWQLLLLSYFLSFSWFLYNLNLPPLYKGLVCCDSTSYLEISKIPWVQLLTYIDHRTMGYPIFLKFGSTVALSLGLIDHTITLALFLQFFLHIFAMTFLYRQINRSGLHLPTAGLVILICHPGLVSAAALPLTDSITTSLFALIAALYLHSLKLFSNAYASAVGVLLSICCLIRPSLVPFTYVIFILIIALTFMFFRTRFVSVLVLIASAVPILSFNYYLGYQKFGTVAFQDPTFARESTLGSIRMGFSGARVFTSFVGSPQLVSIPDNFSQKFIAPICNKIESGPFTRLFTCYLKTFPHSIVHLAKKSIGLFDNFHLNPYAVDITVTWHKWLNRAFSLMGFIGFLSSFIYLVTFIFTKCRIWPFGSQHESTVVPNLVPLVSALIINIFVAININPHIESRYGFPIVPFCILFLVFGLFSSKGKCYGIRHNRILLFCGGLMFLLQTISWD